jgi:metal-sensitive transcriptional repressor
MARIEGQVRGVSRMIEEERYCLDVCSRSALPAPRSTRSPWRWWTTTCATACLGAAPEGREEMTQELMGALSRLVGSR